ncbi:hypothetical protein [Brachybacterium hainanense]|uniref:Rieske domain-containing protein n=1 Tax=Brachybacterium hainanense TaxID=1541174 RepID=A0ABV6RD31_9MICO
MKVIDHRSGTWFLLERDAELLLDVNCTHHGFGYSVLIALNLAERRSYLRRGPDALDEIACAVDRSAPAARRTGSRYRDRDLTSLYGREVSQAVSDWWAHAG